MRSHLLAGPATRIMYPTSWVSAWNYSRDFCQLSCSKLIGNGGRPYPRQGDGSWSWVLPPMSARGAMAQFIPLFSPTLEVGSLPHICAPKGGKRGYGLMEKAWSGCLLLQVSQQLWEPFLPGGILRGWWS